jgi:UDP-N-acetylmuramoyl-tripeptide--D-alanyl-D-alanine ligase
MRPYATLRPVSATSDGPSLSADDLIAATGGRLLRRSTRPIRGGAVDSRLVGPGMLFAALPGERTDGHRFLAAAASAGAAAMLVARPPDRNAGEVPLAELGDVTVVEVRDVLHGLQAIASAWRTRFRPLVVGVTGSIAKTSTKEAVATVLAGRYTTLKNEGNQNNEVGLPLTVLRLGPEHEAAVLEMGMYVGGEIRELAAIARPRIGVVTAVQPVHLSRIGTIDAVEQAKGELVEALPAASEGGVAVLNADDLRVARMTARTTAQTLTYGFADDADVRATDIASLGPDGMTFRLEASGTSTPVRIPTFGRLSVHNALAGAAVGTAAGMAPDAIAAALAGGWSAPHRGELRSAGGVTFIDDSYNASPASVAAALELLAGFPGRPVAVLGEMLELGDGHDAGHRAVGEAAAAVVERLVVVGGDPDGRAVGIVEGALAAGMRRDQIDALRDRALAIQILAGTLRTGDVVLVKASRGIALDVLVDRLVEELGSRRPAR